MAKDLNYDQLLIDLEKAGFGRGIKSNSSITDEALTQVLGNEEDTDGLTIDDLRQVMQGVLQDNVRVKYEFEDNASAFNPVALSVAGAKYTVQTGGALKSWAPVKLLPFGKSGLSFNVPHTVISNIRNGREVSRMNLRDIRTNDIEEDGPNLKPFYSVEKVAYFDVGTKRLDTVSLLIGKEVPLFDVIADKVYNGLDLGRSDLLVPSQSLTGLNLSVGTAADADIFRINETNSIQMSNFFVDTNSGNTDIQDIKAKFIVTIEKTTQVLVDGDSIVNGTSKVCDIFDTTIPVGSVYAMEVEVVGDMNTRTGMINIKTTNTKMLSKVVGGVKSDIEAGDAVASIVFVGRSFDISGELTNTNKKDLGHVYAESHEKYPFTTKKRQTITKEYPVDKEERNSGDTVNEIVRIAAYINRARMLKYFLGSLPTHFALLQNAKKAMIDPNVPNEKSFKIAAIEDAHVLATIDNMNDVDRLKNIKSGLEQKIEKMVKQMVKESGWVDSLSDMGIRGYFAKVLVRDDVNIGDFTMTNGIKVKVDYVTTLTDTAWISLEANGGPVVQGVKMLRLATMLSNPPTTYNGTREVNGGINETVSTTPTYEIFYTLPILGKLTLS